MRIWLGFLSATGSRSLEREGEKKRKGNTLMVEEGWIEDGGIMAIQKR